MKEEIKLKRLERIKIAIERGITCNPETGEVFGVRGQVISAKNCYGYITIRLTEDYKTKTLLAHQFIWYYVNNEVVDMIDHIDGNKSNNKIDNLRKITNTKNQWNRNIAKGYSFNKKEKKYTSQIRFNGTIIHLGRYDTEQEAHQAYLDAKKIYHKI